jgi:hypothetical protein
MIVAITIVDWLVKLSAIAVAFTNVDWLVKPSMIVDFTILE